MTFDLSKPDRLIRIGVILMGGFEIQHSISSQNSAVKLISTSETELLDVAPIDFFNGMSKHAVDQIGLSDSLKSQALDMEHFWVSEHGKPTRLSAGGSMETISFADCPALDIVLIGAHNISDYVPNEKELAFVRKAYDECCAMLLVCAGFVTAQAAGILKSKTCTAPRMLLEMLRKNSPETEWVDRRVAHDGKIWTSGALLNGLDLMVAFVRDVWGGDGSLVDSLIDVGGWPVRSVEYGHGEGMKGVMLHSIDM